MEFQAGVLELTKLALAELRFLKRAILENLAETMAYFFVESSYLT